MSSLSDLFKKVVEATPFTRGDPCPLYGGRMERTDEGISRHCCLCPTHPFPARWPSRQTRFAFGPR